MSGTLTIVATPIGNMQDISLRAIKMLLTADIIACEDTRRAGLLLQQVRQMLPEFPKDKKPRLLSYYDQVEQQKTPEIINLLIQGMSVALISDAGTPLVSDPGYRVVKAAIDAGITVQTIPGPSSVITALTVSGLPTDKFFFIGYLPKKTGHRKDLLESLESLTGPLKTTIILFESPHRIVETLDEMAASLGIHKHIVICRELTKTYEEVRRETIGESLEHFKKTPPKGEFVILFTSED